MSGFVLSVVCASCTTTGGEVRTPADHQEDSPTKLAAAAEPPREQRLEDLPGLDPDVVVAVVNDHQGAVSGCHVVEQSNRVTGPGSVTLTWSIAPNGHVQHVEIAESTFENASFHDCILGVIAGLEFPSAPGRTEVGGWRFRFRSREN